MADAPTPLARLAEVAREPREYIGRWRSAHPGQQVVGVLPMNFPREIAYAAGTLPVVVQDDRKPVTDGRSLLPEFYCGYTRNLADQAATGRFQGYDAVFMADHCIQLIGAADVMRAVLPDIPVFFGMLISSMSDTWAPVKITEMMAEFRAEFESFTGHPVTDEALRSSIRRHNQDRQLIRRLFDERSSGRATFTPGQLQDIVGASMVMDPVEHHALLADAITQAREAPRDDRVRVHLSGHLCHAPKRELLDLIEDSGAVVVDDDLFHGRRYVSTDVDESGDPIEAIARWYARRNVNIPCPTRVQQDADWDAYLVGAVRSSGAEAVIHLLPKFCEPHMLYYPELRKGLDAAGIPQLLLETEHEGLPAESVRTRVETLVERTRRRRPVLT
jgi:bcr-type benzoyl-CoA reductase subunit C